MGRRIRSIKPEILEDERPGRLEHIDWRLYVSLWTLADDSGRLRAAAEFIRANVFMYRTEVTQKQVEAALERLEGAKLIERWTHNDQAYALVRGFAKHQKIDRPSASSLPAPDDPQSRPMSTHGASPRESSRAIDADLEWSGSGREGKAPRASKSRVLASSSTEPIQVEIFKPCCEPSEDRVRAVAWHFCQLHRERLGLVYAHKYGRDGKAVKDLPAEYDTDKLIGLLDAFFATDDRFTWRERGISIPAFVDRIPALLARSTNGRGIAAFVADDDA